MLNDISAFGIAFPLWSFNSIWYVKSTLVYAWVSFPVMNASSNMVILFFVVLFLYCAVISYSPTIGSSLTVMLPSCPVICLDAFLFIVIMTVLFAIP